LVLSYSPAIGSGVVLALNLSVFRLLQNMEVMPRMAAKAAIDMAVGSGTSVTPKLVPDA
jgi:hypothetical protein